MRKVIGVALGDGAIERIDLDERELELINLALHLDIAFLRGGLLFRHAPVVEEHLRAVEALAAKMQGRGV